MEEVDWSKAPYQVHYALDAKFVSYRMMNILG